MKKNNQKDSKFQEAVKTLEHSLSFIDKAYEDNFYYGGISKAFEVCLEYAWKYLKTRATDEGLEVYSPKEAIKLGGRLGLLDDVEKWLNFLEDRNLAVHDYAGIPKDVYLKTIQEFFVEVKKLLEKIEK